MKSKKINTGRCINPLALSYMLRSQNSIFVSNNKILKNCQTWNENILKDGTRIIKKIHSQITT